MLNENSGSQVVEWLRVHATYAVDPGLNPGRRTFAACHIPLSLPIPLYSLSIKGVSAWKKSLKKAKFLQSRLKLNVMNSEAAH